MANSTGVPPLLPDCAETICLSYPLTPEQRIKELEQQLAESEVKALFFEEVVKVMNTEFGATLTKKQLASLSRKHKRRGSQ